MSIVDDDIESNVSGNPSFEQIIATRLSRRGVLGGGVAAAVTASLGGVGALLHAVPAAARGPRPRLGFTGIPVSTADTVVVPQGYTAQVLIAWGDPISNGPSFRQDASNSADDQERQWGMHNDGLVYFPLRGSSHGLLVQNHEYTDDVLLFPDGTANWNADKTRKSLAAHGVSIIEVRKVRGKWQVVRPSIFARRITGYTPIRIGGPAKGDPRLRTSADPTGRWVSGTLNNCAMGYTPWGTYLTCEENFNGYFRKNGPQTELERRYGITSAGFGYLWHLTDKRFQVDEEPNEPNRFGWVVEINPYNPYSTPVKRTALGRFKHEGAWVQEARDGRVVVYSGDDERGEYIYRYVSRLPWRRSFRLGIHPLNDGTLYVARFDANGFGEWIALTPEHPRLAGWSLADILINTRGAADAVGATRMDRPEWIDTFPERLTAIATLTNNSRRGTQFPIDAANPRGPNPYGHIVTWEYLHDWTEDRFRWEFFALAGDPGNPATGSTIVGDKYGSPDGIYVDPSGLVWIQTDVSADTIDRGAYAGFGNNQMLAADPITRETRRFLTGPNGCEVTGVFMTPDRRTMFVGIQHPGEAPTGNNDPANPKRYSSWPDGAAGGRPRSATIVITKDDGGVIGT
ncbi:MAG: PhoX family phosphatase [Steroidobacteraceae bacterium]|nr:PhoX family phosphatase [Steroidobacteraceae bacterium]MDW8259086.1 PhoX family phosphatase [Gammaproteobacteria bacterium]